MRFCCLLICTCLSLLASEPVLRITVGDLPALRRSFAESYWGRLVQEDMAPVHQALQRELRMTSNGPRILSFIAALDGIEALAFELHASDDGDPAALVRFDGELGDLRSLLVNTLPKGEAGSSSDDPTWLDADDHILIARRLPLSAPPRPTGPTFAVDLDGGRLADLITASGNPDARVVGDLLRQLLGDITAEVVPSERGYRQTLSFDWAPSGLRALDRSLLNRFRATHQLAAVGLDLGPFWQSNGEAIFQAIAEAQGEPAAAQARMMLDGLAQGMLGRAEGFGQLLADIQGTAVAAIETGSGDLLGLRMVLALPRCAGIDDLLRLAGGMGGVQLPEEGDFVFLALPGLGPQGGTLMPGAIAIGRDADCWIVGTDSVFVEDFLAGESRGWGGTATAARLDEPGDPVCFVSSSDARPLLNLLPQIGAVVAGQLEQGRHGQTILMACHDLVRSAQAGYSIARLGESRMRCISEGPLGGTMLPLPSNIPMIAIIAAIAVPNLLESRVVANESAAAATLKSGIFPAQITFQAGAYLDRDNDNVGEYGFINMLDGSVAVGPFAAGTLSILRPRGTVRNGYRYKIYLPTGANAAADSSSPNAVDPQLAERYWVAYAWPEAMGDSGRRVFAIDQSGQVYTLSGMAGQLVGVGGPAWNDLYDGGAWGANPGGAWVPYRR